MNKAFIFDMDGVVVDSESLWEYYEQKFLPDIMGKNLYLKIKDHILGNSINKIYAVAVSFGMQLEENRFKHIYSKYARIVYQRAKLTKNIETLIDKLIEKNYRLGLVTVSNQKWIDMVIAKFTNGSPFQYILSLDSENIRPKPFPDGYMKAMRKLDAKPRRTVILEDSQRGIEAAKASGALTICLKENLSNDYIPKGADIYINTIKELIQKINYI